MKLVLIELTEPIVFLPVYIHYLFLFLQLFTLLDIEERPFKSTVDHGNQGFHSQK